MTGFATAAALFIGMLLPASNASAAEEPAVEIWIRAPGDHGGASAPARVGVKRYPLRTLKLVETKRFDIQYDATQRYRAIAIRRLVEDYGDRGLNDTALLRFENGMIIPVSLTDGSLQKLDPLLAVSASFPPIAKKNQAKRDRRPIVFTSNKVVIAESPASLPWLHVDSLAGIELVVGAAYFRQFESAFAIAGARVFQERCQYCHGARKIGAAHGWDFLEPVPLHTYRDPKSLLTHVRHREGDAAERGLLMPAIRDLSEPDANALWQWMKVLAEEPPKAYSP